MNEPAQREVKAGDIIDGKYLLTRLFGKGGMGWVFEGENQLIRRCVAIKVLRASMVESGRAVKRFRNEAKAAGRIG